ncbi:MAG: hypothetical protein EOP50_01060, partial [Sphingobacteriales bacterium]
MNRLTARTATGATREVSFDPNTKMGDGGAGIVFRDASRPGFVAKLYKDFVDHVTLRPAGASQKDVDEARTKIEAMLSAPPDQQVASAGGATFTQIAWPQEILYTQDGRFVGFTMREVDFGASVALEQLFLEQQRSAKGLPQDFEYRLVAAQNLAAVVNLIHSKGHALVDLQPQNVRVYKRSGWVGLIDCDGYRITATRTFPARLLRPEFAAPELQRSGGNVRPDMGDQYQDRFALALIIFSLLNDGVTPFNVSSRTGQPIPNDVPSRIRDQLYGYGVQAHPQVQPAAALSMHEKYPASLRALFDRAFLSLGAQRPSAADWATEIQRLLATAAACRKVSVHGKSVIGNACMLCARKAALDALTKPKVAVTQVSYTNALPRTQKAPPTAGSGSTTGGAALPSGAGQRRISIGILRATVLGLITGVVGIGAAAGSGQDLGNQSSSTGPIIGTAILLITISMLTAPKKLRSTPRGSSAILGGWLVGSFGHAVVAALVLGLGLGVLREGRTTIAEEPAPADAVFQVELFVPSEPLMAASSNLPFRSRPDLSVNSLTLGYTQVDEDLDVVGRITQLDGIWYQVRWNGHVAYLPANSTTHKPSSPVLEAPQVELFADPREQCITGTGVRFRRVPSIENDETILAILTNEEPITVLGSVPGPNGYWYQISRKNGELGFVFTDFVANCPPIAATAPQETFGPSLGNEAASSMDNATVPPPARPIFSARPSPARFSGEPEYPSRSLRAKEE